MSRIFLLRVFHNITTTAKTTNEKYLFSFLLKVCINIYFFRSIKKNKNIHTRTHTHTQNADACAFFFLWLLAPSIRSQTMNKNCKIGIHVYCEMECECFCIFNNAPICNDKCEVL